MPAVLTTSGSTHWDHEGEQSGKLLLFITTVPNTKLCAWGEEDSGGHVIRDTTSRGLCGLF